MKKVYQLFRIQIDEYYDLFKTKNIKNMLISIGKYLALVVVITILIIYFSLKAILLQVKFDINMYTSILTITQIIALIFGLGHVISALFLSHNNDIMLALPISSGQLYSSKMIFIYVKEVLSNALFTLPVMLSLNILMFVDWYMYLMLPLYIIILPLLPIAIISLIAIPAVKFYLFLKKHSVLSFILSFVLIVGFLVGYMLLIESLVSGFDLINHQTETIGKINNGILKFANIFALYRYLSIGMTNISSFYYVLIYIVIASALMSIAYFVIKPFYIKTSMQSKEVNQKVIKKEEMVKRSRFKSLLFKETTTFLRFPGFLIEYHLFTLLMPIVIVLYHRILKTLVVNQIGTSMIHGAHLLVVSIIVVLSSIVQSNTISNEKEAFNLMKVIPVNYYEQSVAKILPNLLLTLISIVITGIVSMFLINPVIAILTTIIAALLAVAQALSSFDRDLRSPLFLKNHQVNPGINKNMIQSMVKGMIVSIFMGVYVFANISLKFSIRPWIILMLIMLGYTLYMIYRVGIRIYYRYHEMYN